VAARRADAWAPPAEFAGKNAVLDRLCQDVGRRPGDVQGTPDIVLSQLLEFRDAGAGEFIVRDDAANVPIGQALTQIDALTQPILPQLT
jgi:hypothetical protein